MSPQVGVRKRYSDETLVHAVDMIKSKSMSFRQAASAFQIPKSTLSNKVNDKTPIDCRPGPATILTPAEEKHLADWAIHMAKIGFGRTRDELLDKVQTILKEDGRKNPFKDDKPGKDWYYAFLKRHPVISERAPQQLAKERAVITPGKIENWFKDFANFMSIEVTDTTLWKDPSRWFNADESGFPLCPKSGKVLAPWGVPNVYNFTSSDKTQITVLACMNANGYYLKPLIVYPGSRFSYNPLEGFPEAILGRTDSGWMDKELFATWLKDVFLPGVTERGIKLPVVLFVDGHSTHGTLEASTFCRENNVILYCLLEHASHIIQPCDLRLFSAMKDSWKKSVRDFQMENIGEYVSKPKFAQAFKPAWEKATTVDISVKVFRDSGLFPLDARKPLSTLKMEPSKVFASHTSEASVNVDENNNETSTLAFDDKAGGKHGKDSTSEHVSVLLEQGTESQTTEMSSTTSSACTPISSVAIPDTEAPNTALPEPQTARITISGDAAALKSAPHQMKCQSQSANVNVLMSEKKQPEPNTVSSIFTNKLAIPVAMKTNDKTAKKRIQLPKAISGKKFHDILLERKRKREEEEAAKEARKLKREEQRIKRQQEKEQKQRERDEKKEQKELKRAKKESTSGWSKETIEAN